MTTIRKIPTSKIDGNDANSINTSEIRPFGELAVYTKNDASTGDVNKLELLMFDGVRTHLRSKVLAKGTFYGGDADSADIGDGIENFDTIKLIPDAELHYNESSYGNDQYLIIDPTSPNHIHIRAGGTQDASTADLFLGGERTGVQVSDATGDVNIRSKNPDQVNDYGNSNATSNAQFIHTDDADIIVGDTVRLYPDGNLFTVTAVTQGSPFAGFMTVVAEGLDFITGQDYNFYRNQGENTWQFNNNGSTRFPVIDADLHNGGVQEAEVLQFSSTYQSVITNTAPAVDVNAPRIVIQGQRATGTGEGGDVYLWGGDAEFNGGDIDISAGDADESSSGDGGYINIQGGTGFDTGGDVTIRGGTSTDNAGGNVAIYGGTGDIPGQVTIATESYTWTFDSAGGTNFPTITTNLLGISTSVEGLKFGDNTKKSVITGPIPSAGIAVKAIIVQGQDQTGAAGGDVCLYGGKSNRDAGDINITAGTSTGASYTGGTVTLQAGSNSAGTAGNVSILGGTGSSTVNHGEVTITSGSNTWTFNNDGNINIPTSKDIREPSGSTAISGGNRTKACLPTVSVPAIVVDTSNIYLVDTRNVASTIILPDSKDIPIGYEFTVTDTHGSAAGKNITITAIVGDLIISAPSGIAIDTNYGLLTFKNVGAGWLILYGR